MCEARLWSIRRGEGEVANVLTRPKGLLDLGLELEDKAVFGDRCEWEKEEEDEEKAKAATAVAVVVVATTDLRNAI